MDLYNNNNIIIIINIILEVKADLLYDCAMCSSLPLSIMWYSSRYNNTSSVIMLPWILLLWTKTMRGVKLLVNDKFGALYNYTPCCYAKKWMKNIGCRIWKKNKTKQNVCIHVLCTLHEGKACFPSKIFLLTRHFFVCYLWLSDWFRLWSIQLLLYRDSCPVFPACIQRFL